MAEHNFRVCVIGGGPAGLSFAREWCRNNKPADIVVIEAGTSAKERFCTVQSLRGCRRASPCHVTSGIGGATGLSGGKLSGYPAGRGLSAIVQESIEQELKNSLVDIENYLHIDRAREDRSAIESERLRYESLDFDLRYYPANKYSQAHLSSTWDAIHQELSNSGVSVWTSSEVLELVEGSDISLRVRKDGTTIDLRADAVVVATGRTGSRDLFNSLDMSPAARRVDLGVRIEFPSTDWPEMDSVHNDLKLHFGDARTFCASKDGWISPYKHGEIMLLEGRTDSSVKSTWSNIAITVRHEGAADDTLRFIEGQVLKQGPGSSIRQTLADYLNTEPTDSKSDRTPSASFSYWRWGDINALFPDDVSHQIREAVRKFATSILPENAARNAHVFGPEMDYYWRTIPHQGTSAGIFAAGDVTGAYRGTLQAYTAGRLLVRNVERYLSERSMQKPDEGFRR